MSVESIFEEAKKLPAEEIRMLRTALDALIDEEADDEWAPTAQQIVELERSFAEYFKNPGPGSKTSSDFRQGESTDKR